MRAASLAAVAQHPREFVAIVMSTVAIFAIVSNALFLLKGPHIRADIAARPLLQQDAIVSPRVSEHAVTPRIGFSCQARVQLIANIQRELKPGRVFYDGLPMEFGAQKTDAAVRRFPSSLRLESQSEATRTRLRAISNYVAKPAAGRSRAESAGNGTPSPN